MTIIPPPVWQAQRRSVTVHLEDKSIWLYMDNLLKITLTVASCSDWFSEWFKHPVKALKKGFSTWAEPNWSLDGCEGMKREKHACYKISYIFLKHVLKKDCLWISSGIRKYLSIIKQNQNYHFGQPAYKLSTDTLHNNEGCQQTLVCLVHWSEVFSPLQEDKFYNNTEHLHLLQNLWSIKYKCNNINSKM